MKNINFFIFCYLFFTATSLPQWFWQNPLPQGNDLLAIQSVSTEVGYACGNHGTFLKTTSGGSDWFTIPFPQRIDLTKLQFMNETAGWVAGVMNDSVYLYKTTEGGLNWIKSISANAENIYVFFINEQIGFLSLGNILLKTIDSGLTWNQITVINQITSIFFIDELTGWIAGGSNVYRTIDGGNSWESTSVSNSNELLNIKFINSQVGWLIGNLFEPNTQEGRVFNSTDGGATWQEQLSIGGSLFDYDSFTDLEISNDSLGWAISYVGKIFMTSNGGSSWEEVSNVFCLTQVTSINESTLWGCGNYGVLYNSDDAGYNWEKVYSGEIIYGANELYALDDKNCYIGGEWAFLKTSDGGSTWEKIEINIGGQEYVNVHAIWFSDSLHGWIGYEQSGGWGGLLMTTDGGYTWNPQLDNISRIFDIYFLNDQLGWFFSGGKCYHTENGGNTWNFQAEQSYLDEIEALQFNTQNLGWAGGYIGLIYTNDGGNSWTNVIPAGINMHIRGISFINSLQGWIVGDSGSNSYIIKTSDGGLTWEIQSFPSISQFYAKSVHFTDSNSGWVVGTHYPTGVVLKTSNGGSTWEIIDFPNSHNLYKINFFGENLGWVLGEGGTVVKTTNGGTVFVENENDLTVDFALSQNYPNPFNPRTNIKFTVPNVMAGGAKQSQLVSLKVYDILGNKIATLVNEEKPLGTYEVEFNATGLPSGVYFYQLKAGSFIQTKKMVYLK